MHAIIFAAARLVGNRATMTDYIGQTHMIVGTATARTMRDSGSPIRQ
jgi:hypothetical protein